jgi:hypothetical protein
VAAPKDVDQHGDSTDQFKLPPPVDCNGQETDMSAFPIRQPHQDDLCLVCHLIEHSLLPHIDRVIDHHEHMFIMHNIAHLLCKGHLASEVVLCPISYCRDVFSPYIGKILDFVVVHWSFIFVSHVSRLIVEFI